jgi:hypothetical protein
MYRPFVFNRTCESVFAGHRQNQKETIMDNSTFRIVDTAVNPSELATALAQRKVKLTRRTNPKLNSEEMLFSLPIGPYKARWLFRINLKDGSVACSGGVTKTFFGHNLYVFTNEAVQLRTITQIVSTGLRDLPGLVLPDEFEPVIERAEVTRHHTLPAEIDKSDAQRRLDLMQMTLLPSRYSNEGRNHDNPGTTRIGKTKSSRACRIYDPSIKFDDKLKDNGRPPHIPVESWSALCAGVERDLRVELMFNKRELESTGLDTIARWEDALTVMRLLESRYQRFGLSVDFKADQEGFTPESVGAEHPTFVNYARHFFSNGEKGAAPNPRSGSTPRYKKYMLDHGYNVDVPFARHQYLAHGFHEIFRLEHAAELSQGLRRDARLFGQWWNLPKSEGI